MKWTGVILPASAATRASAVTEQRNQRVAIGVHFKPGVKTTLYLTPTRFAQVFITLRDHSYFDFHLVRIGIFHAIIGSRENYYRVHNHI